MKKHTLIVTLIAAALLGGASAGPLPTASPAASPGPRCKAFSWNPELYSFYGDKEIIAEKLAKIPTKLSHRRVFLQVTQGDSGADVKLYEQQNDGTFTVTEWTGKQTSGLLADIDTAIIANKGVNCVGEQIKTILNKQLKEGKVSPSVAVPESPQAAFAPQVEKASGEFIKTTIILGC
jgi:hypothetical protein